MANKLSALSLQFATDVILMCDGIHKLQIALKECNETFYWLELLKNTATITAEVAQRFENACSRIRFMLIKSINTAKQGGE